MDAEINEESKPSRKKPIYPIKDDLRKYLVKYGREVSLPIQYEELQRFTYSIPLKDKTGKDAYWETVSYDMREWNYLRDGLIKVYAILKTEGDFSFVNHLDVARIDFCIFGNSQPFRIRIVNKYNDNYDHYYIKRADASRVYGLELEHLLSPNRMTYFTNKQTLIEEHITGIPGDEFIKNYLHHPDTNQVRFAKEFVKFNEGCFMRLLGDMRSYNFVVDITPDIENIQYVIRAIDFDQQSYEGRKNLYLPQFFKDNFPFVEVVAKMLNKESIVQYQAEERTKVVFRMASALYRMKELIDIMCHDTISKPEKIGRLAQELAAHFNQKTFLRAKTMGQIVKIQLKQILLHKLKMVPKTKVRFDD
ncbi:hypothetical protein [Parasediminibacterium sp. JCM 36343]|uniref:hypothetical protein n=1 Tax=Parasediminibacterium sp. JCM 36343 TaxID=3374279 RepID=UPI00397A4680